VKTNCSNLPKLSDFGINPEGGAMSGHQMVAYWNALKDWHTSFDLELIAKYQQNEATIEYLKTKKDLIHRTMTLEAMTENDLIAEILGPQLRTVVQFKNTKEEKP